MLLFPLFSKLKNISSRNWIRVIAAKITVNSFLKGAREEQADNVRFCLCPDNNILVIYYNTNECVYESTDKVFLLELFEELVRKKFYSIKGYKLQKGQYNKESDKSINGAFDMITIPINS